MAMVIPDSISSLVESESSQYLTNSEAESAIKNAMDSFEASYEEKQSIESQIQV